MQITFLVSFVPLECHNLVHSRNGNFYHFVFLAFVLDLNLHRSGTSLSTVQLWFHYFWILIEPYSKQTKCANTNLHLLYSCSMVVWKRFSDFLYFFVWENCSFFYLNCYLPSSTIDTKINVTDTTSFTVIAGISMNYLYLWSFLYDNLKFLSKIIGKITWTDLASPVSKRFWFPGRISGPNHWKSYLKIFNLL